MAIESRLPPKRGTVRHGITDSQGIGRCGKRELDKLPLALKQDRPPTGCFRGEGRESTVGSDDAGLVAPFSASYSTNSSGEPTPAVRLGSRATTVAADGCSLNATFQRDGTINDTAINHLIRADQSRITLKPVPLIS
jgi:hypothetical protein